MRTPAPRLAITERAFQNQVLELARTLHWRVYHSWSSLHSAAGYPDLCMVRRGRLIFAELKSETGRMREEQCEWLEELEQCGGPVEVYLWRPTQWDEIVAILNRDDEKGKSKGKKGARGGKKRHTDAEPVGASTGPGSDRVDAGLRGVHALHPGDARRTRTGGDARMESPVVGRRAAGTGTRRNGRTAGTRGARTR